MTDWSAAPDRVSRGEGAISLLAVRAEVSRVRGEG